MNKYDLNDRLRAVEQRCCARGNAMSRSLPGFLTRRFDIPTEALPGDARMPRVQSTRHGASERFVVSPGNLEASLFHMPGGQSGHPFSPYYRKGHRAWAEGLPTPFLPGATKHTLVLKPAP